MSRPFHLAFIINFTPDDWQGPFGSGSTPWDGKFHTEVAQALERACFDYVIIEDKLMVPQSYGGSAEAVLQQAMVAPKHDPVRIDFLRFELDEPLPRKLTTKGEQGSLDKSQQWGSGKTLRQLAVDGAGGLVSSAELVGTPDQVAERMGEIMEEVGGDGFMTTTPLLRPNRRYITEVADGLVPALQRRGLTRSVYTPGATLRENLREF
ncbi:hypothetical protein GCM10010232_38900 [Streptomyces amakusaensis]|uniref:FMNH2-dependent monooxygenase n=1 Tax=Streptomyces amakusaensis TaxID=67271 RepID=A0ABW0AKC3_9ACTN